MAVCLLLRSNDYIFLSMVLLSTDNTIDMLRKSQDFTIISWGLQHRILGQQLGLGNMWQSSCGYFGLGFLAKVNSA